MRRVKLLLPKGWWNYQAPIRDAIMGGVADVSAWCYSLVAYAKKQTRVAWATDIWLDIISKDFFRFELRRRVNEDDDSFRLRIQKELIRERVTRKGMNDALTDLTGKPPYIFEPWNTGDTGAWDVGNFALDIAGGWGDTCLPAQSFINVIPPGAGISGAPGWDCGPLAWDIGGMWGDMSSHFWHDHRSGYLRHHQQNAADRRDRLDPTLPARRADADSARADINAVFRAALHEFR